MFGATLLRAIEEAGIGVLTLTEGVEKEELLRSRLTRHEVCNQLFTLSTCLAQLPRPTAPQFTCCHARTRLVRLASHFTPARHRARPRAPRSHVVRHRLPRPRHPDVAPRLSS